MSRVSPAAEIIAAAEHAGLRLDVQDEAIRFRGPRSALRPDLLELLRLHKPAIIGALTASPAPAACPADVAERAAIIAEGAGCIDAEAEQRALESVGLADWQMLAERLRRKVSDALTFAPLPCTAEGRRLLFVSRKFIEGSWLFDAVRHGWDMVSLFGVAGTPLMAGKEYVGLVVWLALNPSGAKLETLTEDFAQARTASAKVETYCRFHLLIRDDLEFWWDCARIINKNTP